MGPAEPKPLAPPAPPLAELGDLSVRWGRNSVLDGVNLLPVLLGERGAASPH